MKIIVTTSSFPVSDDDKVPAFVKDQIIELKKQYPDLDVVVHTPHNAYSDTVHTLKYQHEYYREVRYHYFWPFRWELLVGRGIMPALRQNKLLYVQIPFFVFFQFWSLRKLVRQEKPDLIYAHWFMPQAIGSALVSKRFKVPFLFTTHASDVAVLRKLPFTDKLVRWVCSRASAYTAVSPRTASKLERTFSPQQWSDTFGKKLSVIPMGVNVSVPTLPRSALDQTKQKYNLPEGKRYVLFLGRLAEKKGVTYLIDAMSKLDPKIAASLHLIIAGDGQLKADLEKQAREQGVGATFTGYIHGIDKDALLQLADYTCFPSIIDSNKDAEGFPVVVMESLAAGKVVMASNVSGAEAIMKDGQDGYIFGEKSPDEIADALTRAANLSADERTRIEGASRKLAARFDWGLIAKQHYQIFKDVVQHKK